MSKQSDSQLLKEVGRDWWLMIPNTPGNSPQVARMIMQGMAPLTPILRLLGMTRHKTVWLSFSGMCTIAIASYWMLAIVRAILIISGGSEGARTESLNSLPISVSGGIVWFGQWYLSLSIRKIFADAFEWCSLQVLGMTQGGLISNEAGDVSMENVSDSEVEISRQQDASGHQNYEKMGSQPPVLVSICVGAFADANLGVDVVSMATFCNKAKIMCMIFPALFGLAAIDWSWQFAKQAHGFLQDDSAVLKAAAVVTYMQTFAPLFMSWWVFVSTFLFLFICITTKRLVGTFREKWQLVLGQSAKDVVKSLGAYSSAKNEIDDDLKHKYSSASAMWTMLSSTRACWGDAVIVDYLWSRSLVEVVCIHFQGGFAFSFVGIICVIVLQITLVVQSILKNADASTFARHITHGQVSPFQACLAVVVLTIWLLLLYVPAALVSQQFHLMAKGVINGKQLATSRRAFSRCQYFEDALGTCEECGSQHAQDSAGFNHIRTQEQNSIDAWNDVEKVISNQNAGWTVFGFGLTLNGVIVLISTTVSLVAIALGSNA